MLQRIHDFFLSAMLTALFKDHWVEVPESEDSNGKTVPGSKKFSFQVGDLRLEEECQFLEVDWLLNLSGTIRIHDGQREVWRLGYKGHCSKRDILFLRHAILEAAEKDQDDFCGNLKERALGKRPYRNYENRRFPTGFENFCGAGTVHTIPRSERVISKVTSFLVYNGGAV